MPAAFAHATPAQNFLVRGVTVTAAAAAGDAGASDADAADAAVGVEVVGAVAAVEVVGVVVAVVVVVVVVVVAEDILLEERCLLRGYIVGLPVVGWRQMGCKRVVACEVECECLRLCERVAMPNLAIASAKETH